MGVHNGGCNEHGVMCASCRQSLEEWEAGFCEGCGMAKDLKSMSLREAYDSVSLGEIVSSRVVYEYAIECTWESKDKRKGCVSVFVEKSRRPLSNCEVYEKASDAGYRYDSGCVICGCHGDDDDE